MHTDMLDHTPVCKPAVEIHNLAEVEVDIDQEDTPQRVDIDRQLEKAEGVEGTNDPEKLKIARKNIVGFKDA